jgi:hypothetical protein
MLCNKTLNAFESERLLCLQTLLDEHGELDIARGELNIAPFEEKLGQRLEFSRFHNEKRVRRRALKCFAGTRIKG